MCREAILIFEDDDRFKAVERPKEREDLFDDRITELEKKVIWLKILSVCVCLGVYS